MTEKLKEKKNEISERFAHLVTYKNTKGFNNKTNRLGLPSSFNKILLYDENPKIIFNEKTITIKFQHIASDDAVEYIYDLFTELKKYKGIKGFFKKSNDNISLQIFPTNDIDGSITTWHSVKLKEINNKFIEDENEVNKIETTLIFSFKKMKFKFLSKISKNEKIRETNQSEEVEKLPTE